MKNVPYQLAKIMTQLSTPGLIKRLQDDKSPIALESHVAIATLANYLVALAEAIDPNTVSDEMTEILMNAVAFMQKIGEGADLNAGITLN